MKTLITLGMLLAAGGALAKAPSLDGRKFTVETAEKGKPTGQKESFDFDKGKFHSKGCDQYGFGAGAYSASSDGSATRFEADTQSAKEGKIHWTGVVKGDVIEGTYVWTKAGQSPIEYWFKGSAQK